MRVGDDRDRPARPRAEAPLWRQAAVGIALVSVGALLAIAVGAVMAVVVSWLF